MRLKCLVIVGCAILSSIVPCASSARQTATLAAAIAAPDRPKADTDRDANRKPGALLAFAGLRAGDRIADMMPGEGYFTRIFSHAVGVGGHVYALVPAELAQVAPTLAVSARTLAADPTYANVTTVIAPTTSLSVAEPLDLAWTSDNYHDLYAFFGADKAAAFDAAVFRMLKPGGTFIVIDHAASASIPASAIKRLHRIDPAIVKAQVIAAGFMLESESAILRNSADTHDQPVFSPAIRGHTDQFVLKFRKPR
jgi:predicted methyltransferase